MRGPLDGFKLHHESSIKESGASPDLAHRFNRPRIAYIRNLVSKAVRGISIQLNRHVVARIKGMRSKP